MPYRSALDHIQQMLQAGQRNKQLSVNYVDP